MSELSFTRTDQSNPMQGDASQCKSARARKWESLVIRLLDEKGEEPAAKFIGVDKSTVNRLKNDHLAKICDLFNFLGVKVVPQSMQCYDPDSIASIFQLAKERMDQLESPDQLVWEES